MTASSPSPPQGRRRITPDDPRLRARIRARIREARAANWRPWVVPSGVGGALAGFGFVGPDGQGWKAVPVFCLLGVLGGAGLWALARKTAPARSRPRAAPARPQTIPEQLLDLCLLLLVAPLVAVAIGLGVLGGIAVLVRLLD